ncbi:concanavalin A-like lectin/glucanase domain-containing protein [Artemisia annua]|uniref:Concanavalin A-like lectin/glucanase domain-containing protein n=1 Tax=Artemisia annua TaxID=35608 RepID=A0A2U1PFR3_ARTAN|nr:concanavalin A-like lectin/glucanase domain-containing protein [Artemisia annua]
MANTITDFAHLKIPLEDVVKATNNFDHKNVIGEGDFGKVYKGQLLRNQELINISARRLDRQNRQGHVEFWTEISALSNLKHPNIVSLIGFCDEKDEKIIINEYNAKGSLFMYLSDPTFTWKQRLTVCSDIASAIFHIHENEEQSYYVIHCNINSSTILLDHNWEPKLSGFEYSIKHPHDRKNKVFLCEAIRTAGYMDPAIEKTGGVTHKTDIYTFGVVMFEILCGRKAFIPNENNEFLAPLAKVHYENKTLKDIIDTDLWNGMTQFTYNSESFSAFAEAAYSCLEEERAARPDAFSLYFDLDQAYYQNHDPKPVVDEDMLEMVPAMHREKEKSGDTLEIISAYYSEKLNYFNKNTTILIIHHLHVYALTNCNKNTISRRPKGYKHIDNTKPVTAKSMWELLDWNNEWLYNRLEDTNFDHHLEAAASYADLRANVETFVQKATETKDLTEQGVKDVQTAIEKLGTDQGTQLSSVLKAFQDLQTEFKDDPVLVFKLLEFMDSHKATSKALSELPTLFNWTLREDPQAQPPQQKSSLRLYLYKASCLYPQLPQHWSFTNPIHTEATTTTTEVPEPTTTAEVPEPSVNTVQPADKGKAIMTTDVSLPKLVNAPKEVRPDPDAPVLIEIILHNGKVFRGTNEQVTEVMEREDRIKAELLSKPVIAEVAKEVIRETDQSIKGEQFLQLQADMIKEANQKAKLITERKKRNYERYVWMMTKSKGEGPITDILIYPFKKGEPFGATVQRGPRVNEVYTPFKLSDFGIKEWVMMGPILKKKKNKCIPELLGNLTKKYQELERVAKSLGIDHQKALDSQGLVIPTHTQETEDFIAPLHCNRTPPVGVRFVPNKVIKEPEYGIFIIDELKEKAFQRVSDIHLVDTTTLLAYKMMALQFRSRENEEFMLLMDKMMNERPDKDILLTKKAKLELIGIKEV